MIIEIIQGVEGKAVCINGYRVAGPKAWGGGNTIYRWECTDEDIIHAIQSNAPPDIDSLCR